MTREIWYVLPVCAVLVFLGALLRAALRRKVRLGSLVTLLAVLAAAGIWYLWRSDGSMASGGPLGGTSFAAGMLLGEAMIFLRRKKAD